MFTIKKRTLVTMLAFIAAVTLLLAMFAITDIASAETVQQLDVTPISMDSTKLLTGIGSGINVLTATRVNEFKTTYSILRRDAIEELDTSKAYVRKNEEYSYSTTNTSELLINFKSHRTFKVDGELYVPEVGLIQFGETLNLDGNVDFSKYTYKYYKIYEYLRRQYTMSINDAWDSDTYAGIYDDTFLSDLEAVKNGMSVKDFFDRYGTHLVSSAYYGGRLSASFSTLSNRKEFTTEIISQIDEVVSFPLSSIGIESSLRNQLRSQYSMTDAETVFSVIALGGKAFSMSSSAQYNSSYDAWLNSLDDDDNSVIVDYPENGLIPIWEILPAEYTQLASKLKSEFVSLSETIRSQFEEEFKSGNYTEFSGGMGTSSDPYVITKSTQMLNIDKHLSSNYVLNNNIDLSGSQWEPIGYKGKPFTGVFDGKGYSINNLTRTTDYPESDNWIYFGLFGYIGDGGCVQNLKMFSVNINIQGPAKNNSDLRLFLGTVAGGINGGRIRNVTVYDGVCAFQCQTNGMAFVGGLVGLAYQSTITDCTNGVEIISKRNSAAAGGIAGYSNKSNFINCTNTANVKTCIWTSSCSAFSGGIVGVSYSASGRASTFTSCRNFGILSSYYFGGKTCGKAQIDDIYNVSGKYNYN